MSKPAWASRPRCRSSIATTRRWRSSSRRSRSSPEHPDAHVGLGVVLDRKRRHAEAIEHCRAALARNPEHVVALEGLATSLKNIGQHEEALATVRRVLALRPDFPPALGLVGSILAEIGSMDEALG